MRRQKPGAARRTPAIRIGQPTWTALAAAALLTLGGCGGSSDDEEEAPSWLQIQSVRQVDGATDDLITAGAGIDALLDGSVDTAYADASAPTADELRRAALARTISTAAGYGVYYGPNLDAEGDLIAGAGLIGGTEVLAYADDGDGRQNVAMLLQIPAGFQPDDACILAVPVNGSARLYTDVARIGAWGLRRDCAVVYTDKGQGNGLHDLTNDWVYEIDGTTTTAADAGTQAHFAADLSDDEREAFLQAYPHRVAFKHAYSRQNPDATWGRDVVRSIEFAIYELNQRYADRLDASGTGKLGKDNTLVIVSGDSNGGGASLKAGEADTEGLIDGIVASQPQIQPQASDEVSIERSGATRTGGGKSLVDYFTYGILYQPCAALATPDAPFASSVVYAANRCASLKEKGLVDGDTVEAQAAEALSKLHAYGWEPGSDPQQAFMFIVAPGATANKYASAQGRFGVEDRLCGYSIANTDADGLPVALDRTTFAGLWNTASGGAPAGTVDLINDDDPRGPHRDTVSVSPSTGRQDYNIDGAMCMRELVDGDSDDAQRVQRGIAEVRATADLHGIPTVIVHGQLDARVPVNFSSRPYVGLNSLVASESGNLHYVEVQNAGHFGAGAPFDNQLLPLDYYAEQARNLMWAHLHSGSALPPHQVVRTVPRGGTSGAAPTLTLANLPAIAGTPAAGDEIDVDDGVVRIPD